MTMDADSRAVMEFLAQMHALPNAATDAATYRQASAGTKTPPSPVRLARVEDIHIKGPAGPLAVRLYDDEAAGVLRPFLLFLHGGGFVSGSFDTHDDLCRRLARETGWMVGAVEYRLSPETPYPGALEDAAAGLDWAASDAGRDIGIDAARIVVIGDSAGGNLAAALALRGRDCGGSALAGQILVYPMLDAGCAGASHVENATGFFLTAEACRWYWAQYAPSGMRRDDPLFAPLAAEDLSALPPATIVTAGHDPLRDDGIAYAQALAAAGNDIARLDIDGTFHGFANFPDLQATAQMMAFIKTRLSALVALPA